MKNWLLPKQTPNWADLEQLTWIQDMQNCMQDEIWHAEGDVYTHTQMVVNELLQLPEYQAIEDKNTQLILLTAALLHDIAKPDCTYTDEEGRIVSPHHAKEGEKMVRRLLWDLDFRTRETICALVRLHGLPLWSMSKNNPNLAVISSSLRLSNELLYILVKADALGRICETQSDLLERLEFFKELCLENECFTQPKEFYNSHSQFKFFFKQEEFPAHIYDDTEFEIIMLSGIAGSGKDTYAAQLDLPMISLDDLREELDVEHGDSKGLGHIVQKAYEQAKTYCAHKQSFIWNSTNLTLQLRSRLINTLSVYNPKIKIVYLETSIQNILARRSENIPKANLQRMIDCLEMPLPNEAHEVIYIRN